MEERGKVTNYFIVHQMFRDGLNPCNRISPFFITGLIDLIDDDITFLNINGRFGDELVGFLASSGSKYIGFEPNKCMYNGLVKINDFYNDGSKDVTIHNRDLSSGDCDMYKNSINCVYISIPAFGSNLMEKPKYKHDKSWLSTYVFVLIKRASILCMPKNTFVFIDIRPVNIYFNQIIEYTRDHTDLHFYKFIMYGSGTTYIPIIMFIKKGTIYLNTPIYPKKVILPNNMITYYVEKYYLFQVPLMEYYFNVYNNH